MKRTSCARALLVAALPLLCWAMLLVPVKAEAQTCAGGCEPEAFNLHDCRIWSGDSSVLPDSILYNVKPEACMAATMQAWLFVNKDWELLAGPSLEGPVVPDRPGFGTGGQWSGIPFLASYRDVRHNTVNLNWEFQIIAAGCDGGGVIGSDGMCHCKRGYSRSTESGACVPRMLRNKDNPAPQACSANPPLGKPIYPLTGSKRLNEALGDWTLGGQVIRLSYDTRTMVPQQPVLPPDLPLPVSSAPASPSFGPLWTGSLHKRLVLQADDAAVIQAVQVGRGSGEWVTFTRSPTGFYVFTTDAAVTDRLEFASGYWRVFDNSANTEELYNGAGRLLTVSHADGRTLNYSYSDTNTPATVAPTSNLLLSVQDQAGRSVQFTYEAGAGGARIKQVIDPAGLTIDVSYETSGDLKQLAWPDGHTRTFLHERADLPWAVTGITDENGTRLATYGYDEKGRAVDTQWAGGAYHYSVSYTSPPMMRVDDVYDGVANVMWREQSWETPQGIVVTAPNGSTSQFDLTTRNGVPYLASQSQPAGAGCAASASTQSYDANGNLASRTDFNGTRVCFASDAVRNLETTRVEGLAAAQSCGGVLPADAALPAGSRKHGTQWHPSWSIPVKRAGPGRIVTDVYNAQPDPFNSNAIANCVSPGIPLPDGRPVAVVCKRVEQSTSDADGHLGFGAALQTATADRVSTWIYNQYGQVQTATDADSGTTNYVYYSDTTASHTQGDLQSITTSLGKVTTFNQYNKYGQPLQSTDENGVVTVNTYDLRQRLLTKTVGSETTAYVYDGVGQLKKVTFDNGTWVGFDYDDAHRQLAAYDNKANRIDYVLDSDGNRTDEHVKDPAGALKRNLARALDALGRVQQSTGRE